MNDEKTSDTTSDGWPTANELSDEMGGCAADMAIGREAANKHHDPLEREIERARAIRRNAIAATIAMLRDRGFVPPGSADNELPNGDTLRPSSPEHHEEEGVDKEHTHSWLDARGTRHTVGATATRLYYRRSDRTGEDSLELDEDDTWTPAALGDGGIEWVGRIVATAVEYAHTRCFTREERIRWALRAIPPGRSETVFGVVVWRSDAGRSFTLPGAGSDTGPHDVDCAVKAIEKKILANKCDTNVLHVLTDDAPTDAEEPDEDAELKEHMLKATRARLAELVVTQNVGEESKIFDISVRRHGHASWLITSASSSWVHPVHDEAGAAARVVDLAIAQSEGAKARTDGKDEVIPQGECGTMPVIDVRAELDAYKSAMLAVDEHVGAIVATLARLGHHGGAAQRTLMSVVEALGDLSRKADGDQKKDVARE